MVALLHRALLEQKHDEANQRHAFEEGQQDLQQQEAVTKKKVPTTDRQVEDPNMELARYIEKEEKKRELSLPSSKPATKKPPTNAAAAHGAAHAKAHGPPAKAKARGTAVHKAAPAVEHPSAPAHDPASPEVWPAPCRRPAPAPPPPHATPPRPASRCAGAASPRLRRASRCAAARPPAPPAKRMAGVACICWGRLMLPSHRRRQGQ